ncbi:MAG: cystathionine gamma-synthase family protein [Acidimicrobiia bacterium]|nr:cystathionine gamma-synthase family protein [Acidimicrobiia bacterium]MBT8192266.1 cystathionine gamma-synthase family protein [Acidimicrobiia bacterium]MBT8246499.1 cystathionine gamma-synthase family protein [Acidimicrobiia bacterium]NNF88823.1 cystathionine gamma-synthase family protein [Acidimicrobiia bacterium]NNJ47839.1 cystathionine gamma-synthase family protein [Acidimicrobiia bacterium]
MSDHDARPLDPATQAVWGGEDRYLLDRATQVPVVHSVAFGYEDVDEWQAVALGEAEGHIYGRNTNPTVAVFEEKVRLLEQAEAATSAATGMAAISNSLHALLAPGKRVVSVKDTYGGTSEIFTDFLPAFGVEAVLVDTTDFDAIEAEIAAGCDVLYLETPTNPTLKILDLERLTAAGHAAGATVMVDNTFATPINQSPLALGADLVLHSATKFLGGHADALGGVVAGRAELVEEIYHYREINGATLDPMAAYLLLRGMKTLHLRVERQTGNATAVADYLEGHARVESVNYPGLPSHPQHELAARQMNGFGGMLSFSVEGGIDAVKRFLPELKLAHRAANLGSVETTVGPPATTSHVEVSAAGRAALGIPEGLVRYSAGIEHVDDLIADLDGALSVL